MRPTGMDKKLVLILLLTLSWMFVGTYAQASPSTAATTVAKTTAAATTVAKTTAAATAVAKTTAAATTAAKTTAAATTAAKTTAAKTTAAATTVAKTTAAAKTAAKTTAAATTAAKTTVAATTAAKTTAAATTAAPATTTAAPLTPDTNVTTLTTPVSRTDCGTTLLCAAEPSTCDPSQPGSCFFLGAKLTSGRNFEFSLSGQSEGYLAASLSTDTTAGGNDTTYVCANNNGSVQFFGALLDNGVLTPTTLQVNNVKGSVNGTTIQCTFAATVPAPSVSKRSLSTRAQSFSMSVSTGPFNSTSGDLGIPTSRVQTNVVNIANPNATTAAAATTAAPATTTAAPIELIANANVSVSALPTPVSRTDCGTTLLCAAEPSTCDPSQPDSCFFLGAKLTSGRNFEFSLSGQSEGYLAASLSTDATAGGNDTTYVCANNNGSVQFFGALLDNGVLTPTTLRVKDVKGSVNGTTIQCTFAATVPAPSVSKRSLSTRAQRFSMSVSTGPFNSSTGDLGTPTSRIQTNLVNIADPTANITNLAATNTSTTTAPQTTSHAVTLQHSLMQALLVTVGVLGLAML